MTYDGTVGRVALEEQIKFARIAEEVGISGLLVDFNIAKPDSIVLTTALGLNTDEVKFIVAVRPGLQSPTLFVQQINTLSALLPDRVSLNVVAGHSPAEQAAYGDFVDHDQRFARSRDFLEACHALWNNPTSPVSISNEHYKLEHAQVGTRYVGRTGAPEMFVAGSSRAAQLLAHRLGAIWICIAEPAADIALPVAEARHAGCRVGLRLSVICRESNDQAKHAAQQLITASDDSEIRRVESSFVTNSDSLGIQRAYKRAADESAGWLTDNLWNGAVPTHGAPSIALVGAPEQICEGIAEYCALGVTDFIFSGWPQLEEMRQFGERVLPLLYQTDFKRRVEIAHHSATERLGIQV